MRTPEQLLQDAEPFPDKLVQKLPPRGDSYVPWYQYAQRLLLHHPGYSWRVTGVYSAATGATISVRPSDVDKTTTEAMSFVWVVAGELDLSDVQRTEIGNMAIEGRNVYAAVGEADSPTSAESNAFKRACAKAGIGLHLYDEDGYWLHGRLVKGNGDGD